MTRRQALSLFALPIAARAQTSGMASRDVKAIPFGKPSLGTSPPKLVVRPATQQVPLHLAPHTGSPQASQPASSVLPRPTVSPIQEPPVPFAPSSAAPLSTAHSGSVSADELASFEDRFNQMEGQLSGMISSLAQYLPADNRQIHPSSPSSPTNLF